MKGLRGIALAVGLLSVGVTNVLAQTSVPPSAILSEESKRILQAIRPTEGPGASQATQVDMAARRLQMNADLQPRVQHMREVFPVDVEETTIDGISVAIVTPKGGVPERNKNRLMINVPGGGFLTGIRANGLFISIPIASLGQMKVITALYRQAPEFKYPAATEDLTKVYKHALKTYKPANIGMVGCSAGGVLIAQTVTSFQKTGVPLPGALGVYCAGLSAKFDGDAATFSGIAGGTGPTPPSPMGYFSGLDLDRSDISPEGDLAVLAKFPPTIFATGTRDFAMSRAAYGYRRLLKAGVQSELLIYDGQGHGFMTNPDFPESRDLYELAVKFYDKHLGR